jgi:hypothetical protein
LVFCPSPCFPDQNLGFKLSLIVKRLSIFIFKTP